MKKFIFFFTILFFSFFSFAQTPTFQWVAGIGGGSSDHGKSIAIDINGNVYTTGYFSNTVDFDPGPSVYNLSDTLGGIFVSKLDASGNFVWAKQFAAGCSAFISNSISVDENGNIYITGYFWGIADFDPNLGVFDLSSPVSSDIFIEKLDSLGNLLWAKQMGGTSDDQGVSVQVDLFGNVYSSGYFKGMADFDPGVGTYNLASFGDYDVFISKIDSSGNFIWAKQMGGALADHGNAITIDTFGNVYTTGYFQGTADFDPGVGIFNLISAGSRDIFVTKLDASGNLVWAKSIGGSSYDDGNSIAIDDSNNVIITGHFQSTMDFNPGSGVYTLSPIGTGDIFISKLDSSGNFIWARNFGSSTYTCGVYSIFADSLGNVYTSGFYEGTVDFDPGAGIFDLAFVYGAGGPGFTIYPDIFISKLNSSGNFLWAVGMGGTGVDYANSIAVDKMNDVYTTGVFGNTVDFNPNGGGYNLSSAGSQDIFICKMSQPPVGIQEYNLNNNFIFIFPNPATNNLTIETTKSTTISIVDLLGQELFNSKIEKTETIDVSFLANGIYFVKDLKNGGSIKFVKQ